MNNYEINFNKLILCGQNQKFLNCKYNLIKVELSIDYFIKVNDKTKIDYNNFITQNRCKSYQIRLKSNNSSVDMEIYKIKVRGKELRIFYDGNKYPMSSCKCTKIISSGKLIVKPINKNTTINHCNDCDKIAKLFEDDYESYLTCVKANNEYIRNEKKCNN